MIQFHIFFVHNLIHQIYILNHGIFFENAWKFNAHFGCQGNNIKYLRFFCLQQLISFYQIFYIIYIAIELAHKMEDHQVFSSSFTSDSKIEMTKTQNQLLGADFRQNLKIYFNQNPENYLPPLDDHKSIYYFNMFFSPKQTAQSLKRRNDNLEMLNFQDSDQEPDDVFNRRKKKVADLMSKEQQQIQAILLVKQQDQGKFHAIIEFIKFFCLLKEKLVGLRTDYYSNKTFCALKNARECQLTQLTKVIQKMYSNVMKQTKSTETNSQSTSSHSNKIDQRINQFLIIPRFLISKQKIVRLCRDETLQRNFQFLVYHECLGHYNNEANKKMPQQVQMVYVRELLGKKLGRQKFKKICSINHGNKFFKNYGNTYYQLYSKSLQYLKNLDNYLKRGKKYETIKKDLERLPDEMEQIYGSSSYTSNESSNSIYSFGNFNECLNKMQFSENQSNIKSQLRDQLSDIVEGEKIQMRKAGPKRLQSLTVSVEKRQDEKPWGFCVRKAQTMQTRTIENIILVQPPSNFQI